MTAVLVYIPRRTSPSLASGLNLERKKIPASTVRGKGTGPIYNSYTGDSQSAHVSRSNGEEAVVPAGTATAPGVAASPDRVHVGSGQGWRRRSG